MRHWTSCRRNDIPRYALTGIQGDFLGLCNFQQVVKVRTCENITRFEEHIASLEIVAFAFPGFHLYADYGAIALENEAPWDDEILRNIEGNDSQNTRPVPVIPK